MAALFLRNTRATPAVTFSSGVADGAVTVTAVSESGATVATGNAASVGGGTYSYPLGPFTQLSKLTVTWAGTWAGVPESITTFVEVTGGSLFTISEARAFGDKQLADGDAYPDDLIREAHDRIADDFENVCGVPFFPRYEYAVLDGGRYTTTWLPFKRPLALISMSIDGTALTAPELADVTLETTGRMYRASGWGGSFGGYQNVVVEWERGYRSVPEPIKRAALALAHYELVASEITDRQVSFANELGTVRLSVPGAKSPTGIPLVDATLVRYDECDRPLLAVR